jgi:hypothetical protein
VREAELAGQVRYIPAIRVHDWPSAGAPLPLWVVQWYKYTAIERLLYLAKEAGFLSPNVNPEVGRASCSRTWPYVAEADGYPGIKAALVRTCKLTATTAAAAQHRTDGALDAMPQLHFFGSHHAQLSGGHCIRSVLARLARRIASGLVADMNTEKVVRWPLEPTRRFQSRKIARPHDEKLRLCGGLLLFQSRAATLATACRAPGLDRRRRVLLNTRFWSKPPRIYLLRLRAFQW